jgi:hypothetical protein
LCCCYSSVSNQGTFCQRLASPPHSPSSSSSPCSLSPPTECHHQLPHPAQPPGMRVPQVTTPPPPPPPPRSIILKLLLQVSRSRVLCRRAASVGEGAPSPCVHVLLTVLLCAESHASNAFCYTFCLGDSCKRPPLRPLLPPPIYCCFQLAAHHDGHAEITAWGVLHWQARRKGRGSTMRARFE